MTAEKITGTKIFAGRLVQGENDFIALVEAKGFSRADAETIFTAYRKAKVIKRSGTLWSVKHGAFWDKEVLARALSI